MSTHHRPTSRFAVLALCAALGAPLAAAAAGKPLIAIEQAYETSSTSLRLPERVGVSIVLPGCGKHCPSSVVLEPSARFVVAGRETTLAQLRTRLASGDVSYTIFYDPKTRVVTRIIAH